MDRREFVKSIAVLGASVGFPTIIPASALGRDGTVAPSERLTMGVIGLGTQGISNTTNFKSDKRLQLVALCDVNNTEGQQYYGYKNSDRRGLRYARELYGRDIPCYNDFREVLARKDVDVISTATPDHWHAIIGIACAKAGKDVWGEKPLTRTIREGKILRDIVKSSGIMWQTGSWQRSRPLFIHAAELVRNGYLGDIKRIKIGLPSNFAAEVLKPVPVPQGLDFEMWQGPAMRSFYHPNKTFTRWRGVCNYSAGKITDWGAHHLDLAHWALGIDRSGPTEIVPNLVEWPKDGFSDQPSKFKVTFYYKSGVEIEMSNLNENGVEFFGTKGKLFVSRAVMYSDPVELSGIKIPPSSDRLFPLRFRNHFTAFIDSALDKRIPVTDIEVAHRSNTACLLGEIAYRTGRPIKWNPDTEEIVGDAEAARLCDRAYTAPWELQA